MSSVDVFVLKIEAKFSPKAIKYELVDIGLMISGMHVQCFNVRIMRYNYTLTKTPAVNWSYPLNILV